MKQYVIVGGSKGIGAAITKSLANEGHRILVISRTVGEIGGLVGVDHIPADVTSIDFNKLSLPVSIDGLAYCPGSINLKPFHRFKQVDFDHDWQINVQSAVKCIQACLPGLKESKGCVVLFSTVAAQTGMPFHSSIAMAKGAIEGLTRSLAAEYAPTLRFNCIAPSLTNTQLASRLLSSPEKEEASAKRHPLQSVGQPEDIAAMAKFLLSDSSKWITGQVIGIDGGMGSLKTI